MKKAATTTNHVADVASSPPSNSSKRCDVEDPGQRVLLEALRNHVDRSAAASSSPSADKQLSVEEAKSFHTAFQDQNFRQLMAEYVSDISDPKHRKEQDLYIRQLEKEQQMKEGSSSNKGENSKDRSPLAAVGKLPEGKQVLRPQPAFVLKFRYTKYTKRGKGFEGQTIHEPKKENSNNKPSSNSEDEANGSGQNREPATTNLVKCKIFVNVVHAEEIDKPTFKVVTNGVALGETEGETERGLDAEEDTPREVPQQQDQQPQDQVPILRRGGGTRWSVPHSVGPLRMEQDKGKRSLTPTYDLCFHPDAIKYCTSVNGFRSLVADTIARGTILKQLRPMTDEEIDIDEGHRVLRGVPYKNGTPPVMLVRQKKEEQTNETNDDNGVAASRTGNADPSKKPGTMTDKVQRAGGGETSLKRGFHAASNNGERRDKSFAEDKAAASPLKGSLRGGGWTEHGHEIPRYTLSEQVPFDLSENAATSNTDLLLAGGERLAAGRRITLVFRVHLPQVDKASDMDVDVSENRLVIKSRHQCSRMTLKSSSKQSNYYLSCAIPFALVAGEDGTAKWDKTDRILTISIPTMSTTRDSLSSAPATRKLSGGKRVEPQCSGTTGTDFDLTTSKIREGDVSDTSEHGAAASAPLDIGSHTTTTNDVAQGRLHSRWVLRDATEKEPNLREQFAVDGVIPTSASLSDESLTKAKKSSDPVSFNQDSTDRDIASTDLGKGLPLIRSSRHAMGDALVDSSVQQAQSLTHVPASLGHETAPPQAMRDEIISNDGQHSTDIAPDTRGSSLSFPNCSVAFSID